MIQTVTTYKRLMARGHHWQNEEVYSLIGYTEGLFLIALISRAGHIINVTIRMDFTDHHFFLSKLSKNSHLIFSSSNAKIMRKYDFLRSVCPSLWKVNRIIFTAGAKAKRIHNSFFCKIELASRLSNWVELGKSSWSTANLSNARTGLGISTNNRFFLLFQDAE